MQEETLIYIIIFLTGQTITLWRKLSSIEEKIDAIQRHNDQQDEDIRNIKRTIIKYMGGAAKELVDL